MYEILINWFFFLKFTFTYLKGGENSDLPSTLLLISQMPQELVLGQGKARMELHLGLLPEWLGLKHLSHHPLLSRMH